MIMLRFTKKKLFYLKSVGDCFLLNYSGNLYNNDVRISSIIGNNNNHQVENVECCKDLPTLNIF